MENESIVQAWDKLNKINNEIELIETLISTKFDIGSSKLKEILTACSTTKNDMFINSIISKDENIIKLSQLYQNKIGYENYIRKEISRMKMSEPALCIAFLREYYLKENHPLSWKEIADEMCLSEKSCRRYYDEYCGKTPKNNTWILNDQN